MAVKLDMCFGGTAAEEPPIKFQNDLSILNPYLPASRFRETWTPIQYKKMSSHQ